MPVAPARALQQVDVILNGLHGGMGEDGTVQRFLDKTGIPYTGADAVGARLLSTRSARMSCLKSRHPHARSGSRSRSKTRSTPEPMRGWSLPPSLRPISSSRRRGASYGIRRAPSLVALPDAIADVLDAYGVALVEQFIQGEHVSVGIIEDFRNESLYALPHSLQRMPFGQSAIESHHHHDASLSIVCPSHFTHEEKREITEIARKAHQALGMRHFSRADLVKTRASSAKASVGQARIYRSRLMHFGLYEGALPAYARERRTHPYGISWSIRYTTCGSSR